MKAICCNAGGADYGVAGRQLAAEIIGPHAPEAMAPMIKRIGEWRGSPKASEYKSALSAFTCIDLIGLVPWFLPFVPAILFHAITHLARGF